jgi:hypothetical protein
MTDDLNEMLGLKSSGNSEERTNERSTIAFPYSDLDAVVELARALYSRAGRGACELADLAAELNQVVGSAFRLKTAAAKIFGLTEKEGRDAARLTDLGLRIISPDQEPAARAEAFLTVPLYLALFDRYRGVLLPPAKALEREMVKLGVSPKVADRARQAFERSARQAGFFGAGESRLVRPKIESTSNATDLQPESGRPEDAKLEQKPSVHHGISSKDLHPFIQGLLETLPDTGSQWPMKDRAKWLKLAAHAFDLIYEGDGEIEIKAATDAA